MCVCKPLIKKIFFFIAVVRVSFFLKVLQIWCLRGFFFLSKVENKTVGECYR